MICLFVTFSGLTAGKLEPSRFDNIIVKILTSDSKSADTLIIPNYKRIYLYADTFRVDFIISGKIDSSVYLMDRKRKMITSDVDLTRQQWRLLWKLLK